MITDVIRLLISLLPLFSVFVLPFCKWLSYSRMADVMSVLDYIIQKESPPPRHADLCKDSCLKGGSLDDGVLLLFASG